MKKDDLAVAREEQILISQIFLLDYSFVCTLCWNSVN